MTPIQTHETELRTLMERAGLTVDDTSMNHMEGRNHEWSIMATTNDAMDCYVYTEQGPPETEPCAVRHPDPRIALRHCLEMAGLLTDRPPQTDAELIAWLTERAGPADLMERWFHGGYTIRRLDHVWVYWHQDRPLERSIYARELGAILWTAERFPEVNP
jgi:hypothetical protein